MSLTEMTKKKFYMMIQYLSFIGKVLFLMSGCRNAFLNCHCLDNHFPMSACEFEDVV